MKSITLALLAVLFVGPASAAGETPVPNLEEPQAASPMAADAADPDVAPSRSPAAAPPQGSVVRAAFTTSVIDREPADTIDRISADHDQVFFFSELSGMSGQTATHRWEYAGEVVAEVPFSVSGPRWRVYSSKQLLPGQLGTWTVTVVDDEGRELSRRQLDLLPAPEAPATELGEEIPAGESPVAPAAPAPEGSPTAP